MAAEQQIIKSQLDSLFEETGAKPVKGEHSIQSAWCHHALFDVDAHWECAQLVSQPTARINPAIVIADGADLPLVPDNANLMILHHLTDFSERPQQVIREAVLALAPEGKLMVIGFNPISLWGLWRMIALRFKPMPWRANFISPQRMTDWLSLLNCRIEQKQFAIYKFPLKKHALSSRLAFITRLAERYNLPVGAVYVITATKKTHGRTPIRSRWRRPELKPLIIPKPSYKSSDKNTPDGQQPSKNMNTTQDQLAVTVTATNPTSTD